jgi:pimeloyl-ACP methyl ester carboxylesterase
LLVGGSDSRPWFAENNAQLARWLPDVTTVTLEGCDHLAPLTHPAELARVTADFVQRSLAGRIGADREGGG